jgi:hypothetical protein
LISLFFSWLTNVLAIHHFYVDIEPAHPLQRIVTTERKPNPRPFETREGSATRKFKTTSKHLPWAHSTATLLCVSFATLIDRGRGLVHKTTQLSDCAIRGSARGPLAQKCKTTSLNGLSALTIKRHLTKCVRWGRPEGRQKF